MSEVNNLTILDHQLRSQNFLIITLAVIPTAAVISEMEESLEFIFY